MMVWTWSVFRCSEGGPVLARDPVWNTVAGMIFERCYRRFGVSVGVLASGVMSSLSAFTPTEDGMYAVFTTSLGECAVELFYESVPMTVANFVSLAEGSRNWIDSQTGEIRSDPFYDGITFHRIADLDGHPAREAYIIQGGSRDGTGRDGPGYLFPDEIVPPLFFDQGGYFAMANAGPNTNGSQFFFTLAATTHLDSAHTIFGRVVSGSEVLESIAQVETNAAGKPLVPVVMETVEILREGAGAVAFDVDAWRLPVVKPLATSWRDGLPILQFPLKPDAFYYFYGSPDLINWSELTFDDVDAGSSERDLSSFLTGGGSLFVRPSEVLVPSPESRPGKTLSLELDNGAMDLVLDLRDDGLGEYDFHTVTSINEIRISSGIEYYGWVPVGNSVQIYVFYELTPMGDKGLVDTQIYLKFTDETSGTAMVRFLGANPIFVTGTFTFVDTGN